MKKWVDADGSSCLKGPAHTAIVPDEWCGLMHSGLSRGQAESPRVLDYMSRLLEEGSVGVDEEIPAVGGEGQAPETRPTRSGNVLLSDNPMGLARRDSPLRSE